MSEMNSTLYVYIIAIGCILFGFDIIINPIWYSSKHGLIINLTPIKWPLGIILMGMGITLIYRQYIRLKENKPLFSICPKCKESYYYNELKDGLCPKCNIKTENLDGYYDKKKDDEPKI